MQCARCAAHGWSIAAHKFLDIGRVACSPLLILLEVDPLIHQEHVKVLRRLIMDTDASVGEVMTITATGWSTSSISIEI